MGADNLAQFHRWRDWKGIAAQVPLAVVDRGADGLRALASPAALAMSRHRWPQSDAESLATADPPAWTFLTGLKLTISSSALRHTDGTWIPRNDI
jgi:nicotinate-nucleotide adenylyltransferase